MSVSLNYPTVCETNASKRTIADQVIGMYERRVPDSCPQLTLTDSLAYVDAYFECIKEHYKSTGKFVVHNRFIIESQVKAARPGRNPKTGEAHTIPARIRPILRVSPNILDGAKYSSASKDTKLFREYCLKHLGKHSQLAYPLINRVIVDILNNQGTAIQIRGFGTFHVVRVNERIARNPKDGEIIIAEPANRLRFKPSKDMIEILG